MFHKLTALFAFLILAGCDQEGGEVWNASLPWSVKEYHTTNAFDFAEAVSRETGGALEIKVFPGAVLGLKGPETLRALEEGLVDMADVPAVQEAGNEPVLAIESLPFLVDDQQDLRVLYSLSRPKIEADFKAKGLKLLYIVPWPRQNFYTKVKIEAMDDLKAMKIRTYDANSSRMVEMLGMVPLQMPSQDVVPALASGMVDAVMTSTTTGAAQQYWEFLPYIYRTNHLWLSNLMTVNLETWNALPVETRESLEILARDMEQDFWQVAADDDAAKLKILVNNGMEVFELNNELRNQMAREAMPMWRDYHDRVDPDTQAILDQYLSATSRRLGPEA